MLTLDTINLRSDEDILLTRGATIPLFDDYKFEVEDTLSVRYRLIHQTEIPVEGDISYNSSNKTVTFDPVSNLNGNTDYFSLITTGAEDLAGNGLTEDYTWTFRTVVITPKITDLNIDVTSSTASITWNTVGILSNSTVKYNESGNFTIIEKIDTEYVESHTIRLDFLKANTTYNYYIISTDQAGNTNESGIYNFTTSTVPVVTIHSPPSITNDSTPLLNATFDRIVTSAWYVLDGAAGSGGNYIHNLIITLPELSDGFHHVVVDAIDYEGDHMGNKGSAIQNFLIDTKLPTATAYIIYEKGTAANNGSTITLNVSANDNLDGSGIKRVTANVSAVNATEIIALSKTGNYWTGNIVVSATDGNHSINITIMDNAYNVNYTQVDITMDNIPPGVEKVNAVPNLINLSGTVNLTAIICNHDQNDIESVSAEITRPNGTTFIHQMNNASLTSILSTGNFSEESSGGGGGYGCTEYYLDFGNTTDPGRYHVTIIANDTTGNVNDTQKTSFIAAYIYTNTTIKTNAGNSTFINALGTNITLELFTNDSITGSINVTRSIVNITDDLEVPGPGIYIRINASTNFSDNDYLNLSWALIKVNYTADDISNNKLVESSLRLYWYNESSSNWIKLETNSPTWVYGSGVNTANNYIWANISQFSDYAVGGELEEEITPPKNGNSGGSSGGSGTSGEDYYNILLSETDRQSVFKNSSVSFIFDQEHNIVRHINFTALKSSGKVAAKVEILNNTSTLVSALPPNKVYKNLNIWVGNAGWATERNIDNAIVVFIVEKSWITANNIDEPSIALYRYSDDTWHELVTRKIAEDANSLQFEAETPGFSPFAVSGKKTGEPRVEGIIAEPTETADKTPAPTPAEEKGIPGFGLFAGLSVLLIAVQLLRKKK
jgi:PGF-pre-PGF domain-containing protein